MQRDRAAVGRFRTWLMQLVAPFLRYSGAGVVGTVIHYTVLAASVELGHLSPSVGAALGAGSGAFFNYGLNYRFTFDSTRTHRAALPRFIAVAALGVAINAAIVHVATERLSLHYLVGQVLATGTVLCVGFLLNRSWTFRVRSAE